MLLWTFVFVAIWNSWSIAQNVDDLCDAIQCLEEQLDKDMVELTQLIDMVKNGLPGEPGQIGAPGVPGPSSSSRSMIKREVCTAGISGEPQEITDEEERNLEQKFDEMNTKFFDTVDQYYELISAISASGGASIQGPEGPTGATGATGQPGLAKKGRTHFFRKEMDLSGLMEATAALRTKKGLLGLSEAAGAFGKKLNLAGLMEATSALMKKRGMAGVEDSDLVEDYFVLLQIMESLIDDLHNDIMNQKKDILNNVLQPGPEGKTGATGATGPMATK